MLMSSIDIGVPGLSCLNLSNRRLGLHGIGISDSEFIIYDYISVRNYGIGFGYGLGFDF